MANCSRCNDTHKIKYSRTYHGDRDEVWEGDCPDCRTPTPREKPTDAQRERLARALYELEPMWQSGEYVESVQVTPSAPMPWDVCCSFAPDVAAKFYNNADALLAAGYMHGDEAREEAARECDELADALKRVGRNSIFNQGAHFAYKDAAAALRQKGTTDGD